MTSVDLTQKGSFTYEELLSCGRGEMFGDGNAQLPLPPMLMFDRITEISVDGGSHGRGRVVAELDIHPDLWFFKCHFQGDPVMPGCLGLDAMWQMVGFYLGWSGSSGRGRALGCGTVKFSGEVTPDIKLVRYEVDLKRVRRGKIVLGIADAVMFADNQQFYAAEDLKVGLYVAGDAAAENGAD